MVVEYDAQMRAEAAINLEKKLSALTCTIIPLAEIASPSSSLLKITVSSFKKLKSVEAYSEGDAKVLGVAEQSRVVSGRGNAVVEGDFSRSFSGLRKSPNGQWENPMYAMVVGGKLR